MGLDLIFNLNIEILISKGPFGYQAISKAIKIHPTREATKYKGLSPFWNQAAKECWPAVFFFQAEVWAEKEYISAIGQLVNYLILGNLKTFDEEDLHDIGNVDLPNRQSAGGGHMQVNLAN